MLHCTYTEQKESSWYQNGFWRRIVPMLLLVAFLASGCATSGVNRGDVNLVSLEQEWELGNRLEQDLRKEMQFVDDPKALSYVNQVGQRLVQQTELAGRPWEFHIIADPSINAFNTPGGHVYIHTGLITAADNVAEFTSVIAHEIAHGVARHSTEQLTKAYGINIGAGLLLGDDPAAYEQLLAQIAAGGAMASFSRADEEEADRLGVRYMYRAGYDPEGMVTMFQQLLRQRGDRPGAVAQFFSTHPLTEDRIEDVRQVIRTLPSRAGLTMRDAGFGSVQQHLHRYN